ncbi:MAG: hypothetical protein WCI95_03125 [bacterium]
MKSILITIVALLAGISLAGMVDIELIVTPGSNAQVSATAKGVNGYVNSVAIDVAAASTGTVTVAVTPVSSMAARTIVSTNSTVSDVWLDPSDSASRRYAVTDRDTFTLTATNETVTAKAYKAVIRVETLK